MRIECNVDKVSIIKANMMERSEPGYWADNRGEKICGVVECHNESSLR